MSKEIYSTFNICDTIHKAAAPIVGNDHKFITILDTEQTTNIFLWICSFKPDVRHQMIQGIFTSSDFEIPNGANVARIVNNSLDMIHSAPIHAPEKQTIDTLVNDYLLRLGLEAINIKITHGDYKDADKLMYDSLPAPTAQNRAKEKYRKELESTADSTGRRSPFNLVSHIVYQEFSETAGWAAVPAAYAALHEVVSDVFVSEQFNHGNPNKPLIDMYRLGCLPIGQIGDTFLVYVPQGE